MKLIRLFIFTTLTLMLVVPTSAQKTTTTSTVTRVQETQARILEPQSTAYVVPLTVELQVNPERQTDVWHLSKREAEVDLSGKLANIRSWALYQSTQKHNVDVIVAATFNVKTNDAADGYDVTVVGFPAVYTNWKSATPDDYEWIRIEKVITTNDKDKISAIVK